MLKWRRVSHDEQGSETGHRTCVGHERTSCQRGCRDVRGGGTLLYCPGAPEHHARPPYHLTRALGTEGTGQRPQNSFTGSWTKIGRGIVWWTIISDIRSALIRRAEEQISNWFPFSASADRGGARSNTACQGRNSLGVSVDNAIYRVETSPCRLRLLWCVKIDKKTGRRNFSHGSPWPNSW